MGGCCNKESDLFHIQEYNLVIERRKNKAIN